LIRACKPMTRSDSTILVTRLWLDSEKFQLTLSRRARDSDSTKMTRAHHCWLRAWVAVWAHIIYQSNLGELWNFRDQTNKDLNARKCWKVRKQITNLFPIEITCKTSNLILFFKYTNYDLRIFYPVVLYWGRRASPGGRQYISRGARALMRSTTWKV